MKKILVIDDEAIIRTSCERSLTPEGYEIRSAATGKEGIEFLEKESFGIVLLDIKMPDIDGVEILKKIKDRWPEIKVIMITGYSNVEIAVKTLKLGAFNYIEKPFTPDTIVKAVKETFRSAG